MCIFYNAIWKQCVLFPHNNNNNNNYSDHSSKYSLDSHFSSEFYLS